MSGKPLRALATSFVRHLYRAVGGKLPIIGVGGIFTAEDAYEKLEPAPALYRSTQVLFMRAGGGQTD